MLVLTDSANGDLLNYVVRQLDNIFPDMQGDLRKVIGRNLTEALDRLEYCINAIKLWPHGEFDYMHSSQYAIFLYYLSNTIWKNESDKRVCTKIFFLNKAVNGMDCFYEIEMPRIFFIGHSVGLVLAKASYSNYLALYQNSTIGKNHGAAPTIGEGVILYPNTAIIGSSHVGNGSIISQGVSVINQDTPENCLVFQGRAGKLLFRKSSRNILADIFRGLDGDI